MLVKIATSQEEKNIMYDIRKTVFVEEQLVPIEEEIDEHEDDAIHFICYVDDKAVGAARLRFIDDYGKLERICVLKAYRGQSIGTRIIGTMEEEIKKHQYKTAKLHAQQYAEAFYEKLGYQTFSEAFMDAGIPHIAMKKEF
ncbi:MAG TPA: GNAT family N-acetyltransferase [Pseudogracilibacillus sp.]|nr:GNAT family N-acetyltransferase [Pseudogracilibacillus sp.]